MIFTDNSKIRYCSLNSQITKNNQPKNKKTHSESEINADSEKRSF